MVKKKRIGRPPGRTHVEVFNVKLPRGTLKAWRQAARHEGTTVAEMVRRSVADRIAKARGARPTDTKKKGKG
jgi:hypothetical protein